MSDCEKWQSDIEEIKGLLVEIRTKQDADFRRLEDHETRLRESEKWRNQMIGRVAIVSILFAFVAGLIGKWIAAAWSKIGG